MALPAESSPIRLLESPLTVTGTLLGTPAYMSPEQYAGEQADSRSDQFSFCAALYEALYKQRPFAGNTLQDLAANVSAGRLQPAPAQGPIPSLIEQALRRGLAARPEQRFPSMAELLAALAINPQHHPAAAPRARRAFIYTVLSISALVSAGMNLSKSHGELNLRQFLVSALFFTLGGVIAALALRGSLTKNSFHRRMVGSLFVMAVQMVGLRSVALLLGLTMAQLGAMEMMALAATVLIIAVQLLPRVWPVAVLLCGSALTLSRHPEMMWPLIPVIYPIMGSSLLLAWSRAAQRAPGTTPDPKSTF